MKIFRHIFTFVFLLTTSPTLLWSQANSLRNDPVYQAARKAQQEGRIADAEKILNDRIHSIEETQPNSTDLAPYLMMLGGFDAMKKQFPEALAIYQRVLEIESAAYGPSDYRSLRDMVNVASFLGPDKKDQIEQLYKQALDLARQDPKTPPGTVAEILVHFAMFYEAEDRWYDAQPLAEEGMKICKTVSLPPGMGGPCEPLQLTLADIYKHEGRTVEGENVTESAPGGADAGLPPELVALHQKAKQSEKDGLYPDAEFTYRQAMAYIEAHPEYAGVSPPVRLTGFLWEEYTSLGRILELEGRNELAEQAYKEALGLQEARVPFVSFSFPQLTGLYRKEGRLSEMEPIFQHALELQEKTSGESGINVARSLVMFGNLYKDEKKYAEAEALYGRAMNIYEANLGLLNRQEVSVLQPYLDLLHQLHEDAKAAEIQGWINMIENK